MSLRQLFLSKRSTCRHLFQTRSRTHYNLRAKTKTNKRLLCRSLAPSFVAYNVDIACCHEAVPSSNCCWRNATSPTSTPSNGNKPGSAATPSTKTAVLAAAASCSTLKAFMGDKPISFSNFVSQVKQHIREWLAASSAQRPRLYTASVIRYRRKGGPLVFIRQMHESSTSQQPHRPSKDELMAQARGFLERWKIRIKYPLMRQMRPWTLNDITALFSWLFLGQSIWLLVGTTSFVSLILWTANSLQFQEWIAYRVGQYLTSATGATVVFESAIVPNWKDGKIRFNKVHIYRMPRSEREKFAAHAALIDNGNHEEEKEKQQQQDTRQPLDDDPLAGVHFDDDEKDNEVLKKWMWFDLTLERVEVTLSLMRWMDGKGLVQSADVKGVRGVVDRRHVRWTGPYDPVAARHKYTPGDFELEKLTLEDLLVTVYQPNGFRPYPVSIFQAQLDRFRKQWLFYDILCATSIVGSFDKCLFSVHTPQLEKSVLEQSGHIDSKKSRFRSHDIFHYYPFAKPDPNGVVVGGETEQFGVLTDTGMRKQGYKRMSRLRIDGVSIDHINRGLEGPPGWIVSGTVDTTADIYIPQEATEADSTELLRKLVYELTDSIELPQPVMLGAGKGDDLLVVGGGSQNHDQKTKERREEPKKFVMDIDFRFKDSKASVPLAAPELSYLSNAMVRPVVAYINRNKTIVPIKCRIVMDLSNFDGAWNGYDSTLIDRISEQLGKGFVDLTLDQQERNRRLKRIGYWSIREMLRNLVSIHDIMRGTSRGFWSYLGTGATA